MNLQEVFCPDEGCVDKGKVGQGNVVWFQRKRQRCKCQSCGRTFSYRHGTMFYRLRTEASVVEQIIT